MRIRLFILFLFSVGIFPHFQIANVNAQVLDVDHLTIENGMSQTSVNCVIQDSRGFLWVGTQDGLNKFDGYTFKVFKNEPSDTNSLSNNFINCVYEDIEGNLWIGTNLGLNKYNIYTEQFSSYLVDQKDINSIREDKIYNVYQDKSGYLWIKTENYLSRLNLQSNKFRHYEHYNDVFNSISVDAKFPIFEDHKNQLWVGTKDGLNYFDRKLEIFKRYRHDSKNKISLSNNNVKVIFEDRDHVLWIGTENGLNKFVWDTENFVRYCTECPNTDGLISNVINDIFEDNKGDIWIATNKGLHKFDKATERFIAYNEFLYDNDLIRTASVTDVLQDKSHIIWFGTSQGLFKIKNQAAKFKLYSKSKNKQPLFSNNDIGAILKQAHNIWVGTWGTGLHVLNLHNQNITKYNTSNSEIGNDFIHKIFEDKNGNIWIGTQNGLSFFNIKKRQFEEVDRVKVLDIFKNNRIYDIQEDDNKNLWVASTYGLHKISNDTVVSYFHESDDSTSLGADLVYDIHFDRKGNVWAGTEKGLSYIDLTSNTQIRYTRSDQNCDYCLSNNEIFSIYEDTLNNYLWIGTRAGINKFDLETRKIKAFTEKDGLSNNFVYAILPDNSGNLWMSTNKGISKFNSETESFSNFGIKDGLQDFEFNLGAAFKSESGELFFGGIAGYNSFYPDSIVKDTKIPRIEITAVEVQSDQITREIAIGAEKQIELSHKNNLITIEFAVLDFTNPEKHNYAYKLEPVEDEWINLGNRRTLLLSNLLPGKYTFRVKGSNSDDVWNEEGVSLRIIVETPVWSTRFAYFVYVLVSLSLIIWIFRYRTRSLRKSNQELKEKEQIAKQIAKQKEELTIKNKSITDSIIYAKRIQEALMPTMEHFKNILPGSFILYKPKDIVSGDFYWINEKKDKIFVAVVDCTGHGVPGAFMSIIGFELLRNITDDQGIEDPGQILRQLNNGVATTFGKATEKVRIKDGMDIALCVIDKKNAEIEFSGAFRPLYLIRDNKIEEIRGDRFSVGLLDEGESDEITKTKIKLLKDDVFYMFSDGYADQFGGPEGKKYKYRRFRHLLLTIHKLPLDQQLTYFDRSFEDWKGDHEQVDDVLILGIKPGLE